MIFLTGFMGTGKSVVGKVLSGLLKSAFVDMDKYIENKSGKSVADIFASKGEDFFRQLEKNALKELSSQEPKVISTGGGTPCFEDNLEFMKSTGLTVTLLASPETILKRIFISGTERPLLACENPMEKIVHLLQKRAYYYINTHYLFDTDNRSVSNIASDIINVSNRFKGSF